MKQGQTLQNLAMTLEGQLKTKADYIADSRAISMTDDLKISGIEPDLPMDVTNLAHGQIAEHTKIPTQYYRRIQATNPYLLAMNVNWGLKESASKRLVRTLDGNVRAFLSDRYRPIDNYDVAETVLPAVQDAQCQLASCELTERKMYMKFLFPKLEAEVGVGDPVQMGLVVSNSEVGCGRVLIAPLIYRLVCTNGMIQEDYGMRKAHVGRLYSGETDSSAAELFTSETLAADNKAFLLKVRDVINGVLQQDLFNGIVERMKQSAENKITGDPIAAVQKVADRFQFTKEEQGGVLRHLVEGGAGLSQWGMLNAITRTSQDLENYDRATEFETLGGRVLNATPAEWKEIAEAA